MDDQTTFLISLTFFFSKPYMCTHPLTLVPTSILCYPQIVADTESFNPNGDDSLVFFELPRDEITQLKKYTAIFKYRLGDEWESGAIVPFEVGTLDGEEEKLEYVSVIVR